MPTQPRLPYPDFAKADYVSITAYLDSIDWLLLQSNCSQVEDFWSEISNIMMMCIGKFVPMYTSSVERKCKYPKHIQCLLAKKRKLYRKNRIKFLEVSRQYEAAVKNFLTAHEERIISSRKISKLYSYINSKLNHSGGIPPLQKEDGSFALSDKDKCDLLNQYFASV